MTFTYLITILVIFAALLSGGCSSSPSNSVSSSAKANMEENFQQNMSETSVTSYLDCEIESNKNLLWCATFQMAWEELRKMCGEPVKAAPGSVTVTKLNQESISSRDIPQKGVFSIAGLVKDGVIDEIKNQTEKIGIKNPFVLQEGLPNDALLFYACLKQSLRFSTAFSTLSPMSFNEAENKVSAFGLEDYTPASKLQKLQGEQVQILWHRFIPVPRSNISDVEIKDKEEFIVELRLTEKTDRLLLARVAPGETLKKTVDFVLEKIKQSNKKIGSCDKLAPEIEQFINAVNSDAPSPVLQKIKRSLSGYSNLLPDESIKIPNIKFDIIRHFPGLEGQRIISTRKKLQNKPIVSASQSVKFNLDEKGADLESQVEMIVWGDLARRDFTFDGPFLLLLMRKNADKPYFALWIANSELLVPAKSSDDEPVPLVATPLRADDSEATPAAAQKRNKTGIQSKRNKLDKQKRNPKLNSDGFQTEALIGQ